MEKTFYFRLITIDSKKVCIDDLLQVNETIINPIGGDNIEKGIITLSCINTDSKFIPNYSKKILLLCSEEEHFYDGDSVFVEENNEEYSYVAFNINAKDLTKKALKVHATYPKIMEFPSISKDYMLKWCKNPIYETNKIHLQQIGGVNTEPKIIPIFNDKNEVLFFEK